MSFSYEFSCTVMLIVSYRVECSKYCRIYLKGITKIKQKFLFIYSTATPFIDTFPWDETSSH